MDCDARPELSSVKDPEVFLSNYWLKEELTDYCRAKGLPVSGSKKDLTDRIYTFLSTGKTVTSPARKEGNRGGPIALDAEIGDRFVCTEERRAFFEQHLGKGFRFNVPFQKWLKAHPRSTYAEAIEAYGAVHGDGTIDSQFEYNTYIRDFFADNPGRSLEEAIRCWRYRKAQSGSHRYSREDLSVLEGSVL